ncbi:MAG: hypothetical protein JST86_14210 [Bacteroidetes bacterium]|nr:hypothetical protein [Bacteroidota bacterium]
MLKLYIVINDTHFYELKEQEPLIIEENKLPVKLVAKNGFHFSKPLFIRKHKNDTVLVGIGCEADNGRLWGGVVLSGLLFTIYFATGFRILLLLANVPLLYLVYKFFIKPGEFITADIIKR